MTCTLARLGEYIKKSSHNPHIFTAGHSVDYEVVDRITKGFGLLGEDADLCKDTGGEAAGQRPQLERISGSISHDTIM